MLASATTALGAILPPAAIEQWSASTDGWPSAAGDTSQAGDASSIGDGALALASNWADDPAAQGVHLASYVDQVPGDELGVAAGLVGVVALLAWARLRGRRTDRDDTESGGRDGDADPAAADSQSDGEESATAEEPIGFGDLELADLLGRGLLTQVHAGEVRADGRPVAIETLGGTPGHTLRESMYDRFSDGVERWSTFDDHPNVASVVAAGRTPYPWVAMERCATPLTPEAVADRSFEEVCELLMGVLDGIHAGHEAGLNHGAIQPSNVLLQASGEDEPPRAVVADWAVSAYQLDPRLDVAAAYPRIAAPEQLAPRQFREPDSLVDVYQVGILAYALFTGTDPFDADAPGERLSPTHEPIPPSERDPDLSEDLDRVLSVALSTDPDERYQTALHFRDALDRLRSQ